MIAKNKTEKSLGYYKGRIKILNSSLQADLRDNIWPFNNFVLKQEVFSLIEEVQLAIAHLGSLNKISEALDYVEYFSFSLASRLHSLESVRTRRSRNLPGMDKAIIKHTNDYKTCLSLVSLTHPKYFKSMPDLKVTPIEIRKEDTTKLRVFRIQHTTDCLLQLQMFTFLDPLIDSTLPEDFYGFRKGRSPLQAVARLAKNIEVKSASKYYLIPVEVRNSFDSISHKFILENFPFPTKYKSFLNRWIQCFRVLESGKKQKMMSGVPRGSLLGPLIYNFTLAYLIKDFFLDPYYRKNFSSKNSRNNTCFNKAVRYIFCHMDNLMIKVITKEEAEYSIKNLKRRLSKANLYMNEEKLFYYNLSVRTKFDWLGYTFLVLPKERLQRTKLVGRVEKFAYEVNKTNPTTLLLYISNTNFMYIKKGLKSEIKKLKHTSLLPVLKRVNFLLESVSEYYGFVSNKYRLSYLKHFVDRTFWRVLVEKFRFRGIRRPRWVARTFFIPKKYHLRMKWHLHCSSVTSLKKENFRTVWCVDVSRCHKPLPIGINLLSENLRTTSFYLKRKEHDIFRSKIKSNRVSSIL